MGIRTAIAAGIRTILVPFGTGYHARPPKIANMTADSRTFPLPALLLLLVGCLGFAAVWVLAARLLQSQVAWLAPLAALDVALMLRLGPAYAWELLRLANGTIQLAWYAVSLVVAAALGLSGRRPAP